MSDIAFSGYVRLNRKSRNFLTVQAGFCFVKTMKRDFRNKPKHDRISSVNNLSAQFLPISAQWNKKLNLSIRTGHHI